MCSKVGKWRRLERRIKGYEVRGDDFAKARSSRCSAFLRAHLIGYFMPISRNVRERWEWLM